MQESSARGNPAASLRELRRVIKPAGLPFIYQLPQTGSWQESLQGVLRMGYHHPVKYTRRTIGSLLHEAGFSIERVARANLLPKNLTGMPRQARNAFGRLGQGRGADRRCAERHTRHQPLRRLVRDSCPSLK